MTQERTPDEQEITNRTNNSIEKIVRARRVAAQTADILRRLTIEGVTIVTIVEGWGGVSCKHNLNL